MCLSVQDGWISSTGSLLHSYYSRLSPAFSHLEITLDDPHMPIQIEEVLNRQSYVEARTFSSWWLASAAVLAFFRARQFYFSRSLFLFGLPLSQTAVSGYEQKKFHFLMYSLTLT